MRQDIKRIKASAVRVGDTLCCYSPDPSQDQEVYSIYKRMDGSLVFNELQAGGAVRPSDFVFIKIPACESAPVESLPSGEYVKRKADSSKVYQRADYDRSLKAYRLDDVSDCSRCIYVKKGTSLFFGFTY